jgi:hypothetical protein
MKIILKTVILCLYLIGEILSQKLFAQGCQPYLPPDDPYQAKTHNAQVDVGWYPEWTEKYGEKLPDALKPLIKWDHPYMKKKYASEMHEDSYASDVSNMPGPNMNGTKVQYFHSLQKGKGYSGMSPSFAFIDDTTIVTLSFGRANTTLLLLDVANDIQILDTISIPGRGSSALDLAKKTNRMAIFRNTSGGCYFYLSDKNRIYIPGSNNNILRIQVENREFKKKDMTSINIQEQILAGSLIDPSMADKDQLNVLTAILPDSKGNIWFTSKYGIIGLIHRNDKYGESDCPKVYANFVGFYGAKTKLKKIFADEIHDLSDLHFYQEGKSLTPELRQEFIDNISHDSETREEIQNSFSVSEDGVFLLSNFALYKFFFNEKTKHIEMDPKWKETFKKGDLIYNNDLSFKPGHLNNGGGTTPTLMDNRFVAIGDNDTSQINICIYDQETGELVFRHKLFEDGASACENSIVAYKNSFVIANTYGYVDPFKTNETPGGIMRFDYNESKESFELNPTWPAAGLFDPKTATPKLSAGNGLIYVYNRSDDDFNGHNDWQLTAVDFRTGYRVFYIRPYFDKKQFKDNVGFVMKSAMGSKNYDRKVFNNIWATYAFGPNNSIYIGAYRGFLKFSSDE